MLRDSARSAAKEMPLPLWRINSCQSRRFRPGLLLRNDCVRKETVHQRLLAEPGIHTRFTPTAESRRRHGQPADCLVATGLRPALRVLSLTTAHLENASRFPHLTAESDQQQATRIPLIWTKEGFLAALGSSSPAWDWEDHQPLRNDLNGPGGRAHEGNSTNYF